MATSRVILPLALAVALSATPGWAQVENVAPDAGAPLSGFFLTTPAPEFTASPAGSISIPLRLSNIGLPPQRASIEVSGLPEDWDWTLLSGGTEISAAIVDPDSTQDLTLQNRRSDR